MLGEKQTSRGGLLYRGWGGLVAPPVDNALVGIIMVDRVPIPVIPIQGWTLLNCKDGGSILKFEATNL